MSERQVELAFEGTTTEQLVEVAGTHEKAFDALAGHIVTVAVQKGYIEDFDEGCRDAADLLTSISAKAVDAEDDEINDLVGVAVELWDDKRTHQTFSFGVEVIKYDGQFVIWRPQ